MKKKINHSNLLLLRLISIKCTWFVFTRRTISVIFILHSSLKTEILQRFLFRHFHIKVYCKSTSSHVARLHLHIRLYTIVYCLSVELGHITLYDYRHDFEDTDDKFPRIIPNTIYYLHFFAFLLSYSLNLTFAEVLRVFNIADDNSMITARYGFNYEY